MELHEGLHGSRPCDLETKSTQLPGFLSTETKVELNIYNPKRNGRKFKWVSLGFPYNSTEFGVVETLHL